MIRILVIDDEALVRDFIRQILETEHYQVSEAADGEEGLACVRTSPVNAAIVDIFMPNKEGIETIRTLQRDYPHIKIIAISGGGAKGRVEPPLEAALTFGAHKALMKPFSSEELLTVVHAALAQ
jgi:CheY-like chemotaxis protein